MTENNNTPQNKKSTRDSMGTWIVIGVIIGAAMGGVFDSVAIGVAVGIALGVAMGALVQQQRKQE